MNADFWAAVASIAATVALVLSVVNYFQGREKAIGWTAQRSQVHDVNNHFRLRNDSSGLRARVIALDDNFRGMRGDTEMMIFNYPSLPAVIEPGNWLPVAAHQILNQEPIAVMVTWQQAKLGSDKFSRKTFQTQIYL